MVFLSLIIQIRRETEQMGADLQMTLYLTSQSVIWENSGSGLQITNIKIEIETFILSGFGL